jgi:TfoX/Sxy family transcriptional regulator of competence genes
MRSDPKLVERVRRVLDGEPGVGERRMFGGVCFTLHGNMACGVQRDELVVRVGPEAHADALRDPFARPMDFTGRPMKGYVYVAAAGCGDLRSTRRWVTRGVRFARSLPRQSSRRT